MRPIPHFSEAEIAWFNLRAVCRQKPENFIARPVPPPTVYWRIIALVVHSILTRKP